MGNTTGHYDFDDDSDDSESTDKNAAHDRSLASRDDSARSSHLAKAHKKKGLRKLRKYHAKSTALEDLPYYHGKIPREEIESEKLLQWDGDFLLRESDKYKEPIILSVFWKGKNIHVPLGYSIQHMTWTLGSNKTFPNVPDLIFFHVKNKKKVGQSQATLCYPVPKDEFQLNNDDVTLRTKIGQGHFGEVWLATLSQGKKTEEVAVKLLLIEATIADPGKVQEEKKKFLAEARIMKRYRHENVIRFIGIGIMRDPMMLVMELLKGGGLDGYLTKNPKCDQEQMWRFCMDAANGMQYLEDRKCIHRDLAARNCLLTTDLLLKISDFGMSREGDEYQIVKTRQVPIRWTAPEVIQYRLYTHKSDVWSYGVLMWEIYSEGALPYSDIATNKEVTELVCHKEYRMPHPQKMPRRIGAIMDKCWLAKKDERISFSEIADELRNIEGEYMAKMTPGPPPDKNASRRRTKSDGDVH